MKRILLTVLGLFFFLFTQAQTSVFHEDFEVVDSVVSSGNPTWYQNNTGLYTSATHCIRDTVVAISSAVGDSAYLTTIAFSTTGNSNVILNFNHICKISVLNGGTIEVSN